MPGLATVVSGAAGPGGTVLDTWFPGPELIPAGTASGTTRLSAAEAAEALGPDVARRAARPRRGPGGRGRRGRHHHSSLAAPPADGHDAYLRLHLLSGRLIRPRGCNVDGIFGVLANVVWTSHGPCPVPDFEATRMRLRRRGPVAVYGVDKFPRMVDYVLPAGVRIADADRVRLGAHLAEGTTVMHEGFVNYNAGTLGTSMVEGRISAGEVVGDGSDVGGGASIMGTLSGGGKETISVGERCLIGANAGVGISLGDDCVVEAGLYRHGGDQGRAAGRAGGQGPEPVRPPRAAVAARLADRRGPGHRAWRAWHRAERGAARQRLTVRERKSCESPPGTSTP